MEAMRRTANRVAPEMPVRFSTMESRLSDNVAAPRFRALLLAIFAGIAIVLTVAGIYGVVSFLVNQRGQEIGVRLALGATPGQVRRMILKEGLLLTAIGVPLGAAGAMVGAQYVAAMLFETTPLDPATYLVVSALVALAAVGACGLPALRASNVEPATALRTE